MTKTQINTLLTSILGGSSIDADLFDTLLQMVKNLRENARDWMLLRSVDTSITFTSADDYTSTKSLPSNFIRVYRSSYKDQDDMGVALIDSNGALKPLKPITLGQRYLYKDTPGYYYIDVRTSKIGRTGTDAGTLLLNFIQGTNDISDDVPWIFPTFAHPLLAFDIAIMQKGGIDWDVVASFSVPYNAETLKRLEEGLEMWDARLQQDALGI